jgi:hypothetical protein
MFGSETSMDESPPTPIVGMVVVGSLLILVEGLLELGLSSQASVYGLPIPPSLWAVPAFTIALAALLLLLVWRYATSPTWGLGVLFIVLGMLSFVLGGGFLVGGILILIGGALACFADWVQELVIHDVRFARARTTSPPPESRDGESPRAPVRDAAEPAPPAKSAGIVVYRPCPSCGTLNRRELIVCPSCGKSIDS